MAGFSYNRDAAVSLAESMDRYCSNIVDDAKLLLSLMNEGYWKDEKREDFNKEIRDNFEYITKAVAVLSECSEDLKKSIRMMDS